MLGNKIYNRLFHNTILCHFQLNATFNVYQVNGRFDLFIFHESLVLLYWFFNGTSFLMSCYTCELAIFFYCLHLINIKRSSVCEICVEKTFFFFFCIACCIESVLKSFNKICPTESQSLCYVMKFKKFLGLICSKFNTSMLD